MTQCAERIALLLRVPRALNLSSVLKFFFLGNFKPHAPRAA
jgi:hypothetical protein